MKGQKIHTVNYGFLYGALSLGKKGYPSSNRR